MKKTDKIYICIIILLMLLCLRSCKKAPSKNTIKESNSIGINTYKKPILSIKTINEVHVKDRASVSYDTIFKHDTITNTDSFYIDLTKPIYKLSFKDKWKSGNIIAKFDTIELRAKFIDYSHVLISQKRGVFKNQLIFTEIKQENPNTIMMGISHSSIKPKNKLFNIGLQSGVGIDLIRKKPTVYVGVVIGFDLVR